MFRGFREFLLRGNVVDLAVAVVIGAAFGAVIDAFVKNLMTPFIAALIGKPDFSALSLTIGSSQLLVGAFLNALISFVMTAAAVYFFIVAPMNAIAARRRPAAEPATRKCGECLSDVPVGARRCAFCTSPLV